MELTEDLPRAIEGSNRALSKGVGPPTLLFSCLPELGGQALPACSASLGASGEGALTQWDPPLVPLQRHHFAQAIAILNTHGCNIFDHFSRKVTGPAVSGCAWWELGTPWGWTGCVRQGPW